jgi:hypothetical protein
MDNKIVNGERAISTSAIGYKIGLPGASVVNLKRLGAIPLIESSHATYWREDDIPAIAEKVKRWLKHMDSFDPTTAGVKDVETKARKSPDKSSGKYRAEARAKLKDAILCSLRQNGATGGTALANRMEVPITHRTDFHRVLREMVSAGFIKGEFVGEVGSRKQHRQTYWIGTNGRPQPALKLASSHESVNYLAAYLLGFENGKDHVRALLAGEGNV